MMDLPIQEATEVTKQLAERDARLMIFALFGIIVIALVLWLVFRFTGGSLATSLNNGITVLVGKFETLESSITKSVDRNEEKVDELKNEIKSFGDKVVNAIDRATLETQRSIDRNSARLIETSEVNRQVVQELARVQNIGEKA